MWNEKRYAREIEAYTALNATDDPEIEKRGIPRIYYHGKLFSERHAIAMTLFEETLYHRFKFQHKNISELSILLIFKRAVCAILNLLNHKILIIIWFLWNLD